MIDLYLYLQNEGHGGYVYPKHSLPLPFLASWQFIERSLAQNVMARHQPKRNIASAQRNARRALMIVWNLRGLCARAQNPTRAHQQVGAQNTWPRFLLCTYLTSQCPTTDKMPFLYVQRNLNTYVTFVCMPAPWYQARTVCTSSSLNINVGNAVRQLLFGSKAEGIGKILDRLGL